MGQRLVVEIRDDNERGISVTIAAIYYHWSAYSVEALRETARLIDVIQDEDNPIKDMRLRLIHYIESVGGGIDGGENSEEWEYIKKLYPDETFKSKNISRNEGLIAVSERGIRDIKSWSEGNVVIDIPCGLVSDYVYFTDDLDTINKYREDDGEEPISIDDIPEMIYNLEEIPFEDVEIVADELDNLPDYMFKQEGQIYTLIR